MATLTVEELLAGSHLTHPVSVPPELHPGNGVSPGQVVLRPLTVKDIQLITRAAKDDAGLTSALMLQQALVEPNLTTAQVGSLPAGVARFLLDEINRISGLATSADELTEQVQAPLARACFTLAREFGWTPEEVSGMTIGQILLYLQMTRSGAG